MAGGHRGKSRIRGLGAVALCSLGVIVGAFLFLHSGPRAAAVCERARFVDSGSLSVWPPGADCTYGEPATTDTLINDWFWLVTVAVLMLGGGAVAVVSPARGGSLMAGGERDPGGDD
jgi:hypothetical protein